MKNCKDYNDIPVGTIYNFKRGREPVHKGYYMIGKAKEIHMSLVLKACEPHDMSSEDTVLNLEATGFFPVELTKGF